MFYVTDISGNLVPFDPANTAGVVRTVATVEVAEPSARSSAGEVTDDSAIYEGSTVTRGDLIFGNASSLGWAGALRSYRVQASDRVAEALPMEGSDSLGAIESVQEFRTGLGDSPQRVDPIRGDRPGYRPAERERRRAVLVQDLMSAPVFTVSETLPIEEAERVFRLRKFRHIPVVSAAGALVGILSDRDFFGEHQSRSESESGGGRVRDRMVTNILTARPETGIRIAAEVMITHHIGCLPIVDERGELVGVLTRSDILRAIVNHAPIELWT